MYGKIQASYVYPTLIPPDVRHIHLVTIALPVI